MGYLPINTRSIVITVAQGLEQYGANKRLALACFTQTLTSKQSNFNALISKNYNVGNNLLCNRLIILSCKIKLQMLKKQFWYLQIRL